MRASQWHFGVGILALALFVSACSKDDSTPVTPPVTTPTYMATVTANGAGITNTVFHLKSGFASYSSNEDGMVITFAGPAAGEIPTDFSVRITVKGKATGTFTLIDFTQVNLGYTLSGNSKFLYTIWEGIDPTDYQGAGQIKLTTIEAAGGRVKGEFTATAGFWNPTTNTVTETIVLSGTFDVPRMPDA